MLPRQPFFGGEITVIRPLALLDSGNHPSLSSKRSFPVTVNPVLQRTLVNVRKFVSFSRSFIGRTAKSAGTSCTPCIMLTWSTFLPSTRLPKNEMMICPSDSHPSGGFPVSDFRICPPASPACPELVSGSKIAGSPPQARDGGLGLRQGLK